LGFFNGCGLANLSSPMGGSAKGIPKNSSIFLLRTLVVFPFTTPEVVFTSTVRPKHKTLKNRQKLKIIFL